MTSASTSTGTSSTSTSTSSTSTSISSTSTRTSPTSTATDSSSSLSSLGDSPNSSSGKGLSSYAKAGISIGVIVGCLLLSAGAFSIYRCTRYKPATATPIETSTMSKELLQWANEENELNPAFGLSELDASHESTAERYELQWSSSSFIFLMFLTFRTGFGH